MHAQSRNFSAVMSEIKRQVPALALFSCLVNLLLLVTAIYMLQVYDRVLSSGSIDTLVWLTFIALFAIAIYGVLEQARRAILGRIGGWLDGELAEPVVRRAMEARLTGVRPGAGPRDVADLRTYFAGDAVLALFDAPWSVIFLAFIWSLHPALGMVATAGAALLFGLALANDLLTRTQQQKTTAAMRTANEAAIRFIESGETISPLGMTQAIFAKWRNQQRDLRSNQLRLEERTAAILSISRAFRLSLQVLVLGVGAFCVLAGELTAGAMIAASIIMGRALAPIERSIGGWRRFVAARAAYRNLKGLLAAGAGAPAEAVKLPRPAGRLAVENVSYLAPQTGAPIIKNVSFALEPGQTCVIVGPSGSGKSSLCRLLVGLWQPRQGHVRLDGADVFSWDAEDLGQYVGYLPQQVELFAGSVAENIARFGEICSEKIVAAARLAGVHEMILALANGYETDVGLAGDRISLGQRQRLGLARALYDDPSFIVLDEPNSHLDQEGEQALAAALRRLKQEGRTIVIVTHRPVALQTADKALVMREGVAVRFGDRDSVLKPFAEAAPPLRVAASAPPPVAPDAARAIAMPRSE